MNNFKLFDIFPKPSMETLTHSTIIGAILSLTSICLIIFLTVVELINYWKPIIKTDALIIQDQSKEAQIAFNLSLFFDHLPCNIISFDLEDSKDKHIKDINTTIQKIKVLKNNTHIPFIYHNQKAIERFFNALKEEEGCLLSGFVNIPKAPGNIHISFHPFGHIWNSLRHEADELKQKLKLSHRFTFLHFGNVDAEVLNHFGMNLITFDRLGALPNFLYDDSLVNYEYYVKIIPYLLQDKDKGTQNIVYQYSLLYKVIEYDEQRDKMPYLMLHYDYSPITMRLLLYHMSLAHFLTKICAIIGGIFTVFSILNQILSAYSDINSYVKVENIERKG